EKEETDSTQEASSSSGKKQIVKTRVSSEGYKKGFEERKIEGVMSYEEAWARTSAYRKQNKDELSQQTREIRDELLDQVNGHYVPRILKTSIPGAEEVTFGSNDIKKMMSDSAIRVSIMLGVSPETHIEAVRKTLDLIDKAKFQFEGEGGKKNISVQKKGKKTEEVEDDTEKTLHAEAPLSASDGKNYTVRYTIKKYRESRKRKPALYSLYCRPAEN
ncbi:MAG: hypothetical protein ACI4PY_01495, partial [Akkermansia muciniphila]